MLGTELELFGRAKSALNHRASHLSSQNIFFSFETGSCYTVPGCAGVLATKTRLASSLWGFSRCCDPRRVSRSLPPGKKLILHAPITDWHTKRASSDVFGFTSARSRVCTCESCPVTLPDLCLLQSTAYSTKDTEQGCQPMDL